MALIARILGVSLLTSALVAGLGLALLKSASHPVEQAATLEHDGAAHTVVAESTMSSSEYIIPVFFLACVGGVIGAVTGAAREIVSAQRQKASHWADTE
jgi:hypothetical protein